MKERLQKHLARAGLGSRRYCETLIEQGRVKVNGKTVDQPGFQVDATADRVEVDGKDVEPERAVYYLLHKPKGFVCTSRPQGSSRSALELVRGRRGERLFCVGRLDEDSQGALLLTNGLGAAIGPTLTSFVMEHVGVYAFPLLLAVAHAAIGLFALWRMTRRPAPAAAERGPAQAIPTGSPYSTVLTQEASATRREEAQAVRQEEPAEA